MLNKFIVVFRNSKPNCNNMPFLLKSTTPTVHFTHFQSCNNQIEDNKYIMGSDATALKYSTFSNMRRILKC